MRQTIIILCLLLLTTICARPASADLTSSYSGTITLSGLGNVETISLSFNFTYDPTIGHLLPGGDLYFGFISDLSTSANGPLDFTGATDGEINADQFPFFSLFDQFG